ncbi:unnamed protein product [Prorocentrum cordatum]|uniref:Uncharacterized protein n=1 Tax=Prorocentrum cordatum TaxID=2364126 RepID=A0ABN9UCV8_9DINO|nr:unnamed protein product [Polarella glacialis]
MGSGVAEQRGRMSEDATVPEAPRVAESWWRLPRRLAKARLPRGREGRRDRAAQFSALTSSGGGSGSDPEAVDEGGGGGGMTEVVPAPRVAARSPPVADWEVHISVEASHAGGMGVVAVVLAERVERESEVLASLSSWTRSPR